MNFEKVKDIIVDTISCDANEVTMEASLREDLGADSLSAVELIMALEDNFDIKISDEEMKEILVYSNCPQVELIVNGVPQGIKKRNSQDYPINRFTLITYAGQSGLSHL